MLLLALLLHADDVGTLVREYLADPAKNKALVEKIAARSIGEVEIAVRASRTYEKRDPGVVNGAAANTHDPSQIVPYLILVPPHDPEKLHPLLVSLHGQNGSAKSHIGNWRRDVEKEDGLFLLVPDAARGGWGRSRLGFGNVHGVIRAALAKYPIDPNRVILDGGSMGGNGSFQFGTCFPDMFAAMAPRIGGPEFVKNASGKVTTARFLENLRNLPVYWIVGAQDEMCPIDWARVAKNLMEDLKLDLTCRELDGGHEWFPQENPKVLEWLRAKKRDPYPRVVHWVTHERIWNRSYWLEITAISKAADERRKRTYMTDKNEPIEERLAFVHAAEVYAEIDREVTVYVDGAQKTRKKVTRSARTVLESAQRDREMLFSAMLDVKLK